MHALMFLAPAHFHAALTLRQRHPLVADEIFVYCAEAAEVREFLDLVKSLDARGERATGWRPVVRAGGDPLGRLLAERPGDVVILAGRNDGKAASIRRLHEAGLPVLADKPWLTEPGGIVDLRAALAGPPLALEMMTGRHDVTTAVERLLVGAPDVFGEFAADGGEAAVVLDSVHHLEKRVNGAPLRRPPWYFDVRVQGDGLADIPTHLVDHAQQLVAAARAAGTPGAPTTSTPPATTRPGAARPELELVDARRWATAVPRETFARVTGQPDFPGGLAGLVDDGRLQYLCNGRIVFRCGGVLVDVSTRWDLSEPAGGGDRHRVRVRGTRAEVLVEHGAATGWRRRLVVEPRPGATGVEGAVRRCVDAWQAALPGLGLAPATRGWEVVIPPSLGTPHESQFPRVLEEFLGYLGRGEWPARRSDDTLAKYDLLARARTLADRAPLAVR